jgi:tetratricopeptide (TPR) repeat protein
MKKFFVFAALAALSLIIAAGCSQTVDDKVEKVRDYLKVGKFAQAQKKVEEIVLADSTSPAALYSRGLLEEYRALDWDALIKFIDASPMSGGYLPAMESFIDLAIEIDYLENARKMCNLYAKRQTDDPQTFLNLVTIDIRENKLDSARAHLAQAAALSGDDLEIVLIEAEIDFHSFDETSITNALTKLSQTNFKTAGHFSHLASLYSYLNMNDSAIFYSRRAVDKDDDILESRMQLAQYLMDEMRLHEAHEVAAEIVSDAEEYGPGLIRLAEIKWAMKRENAAEQSFFKFMTALSQRPITYEKHGDFYALFDGMEMGVMEYQAAYTMAANLKYPDDYLRQVYLKMMNGFLDVRDIGMGIDYFEEGKSLLPNSLEMRFFEAELKGSFENTADSARMMVDNRVEQNWDNAIWLDYAARYFFRRKVYDKAAEMYSRLMELPYPKLIYYIRMLEIAGNNNDVETANRLVENLPFRYQNNRRLHELLFTIYDAADQRDKAAFYAEVLYRHSNEYIPYNLQLAEVYSRQGRKTEARAVLTRFQDRFPQNPESHYQLARFDYENGDYSSVTGLIDRSLALDTGYAFAYELLGEYMEERGNMDSAIASYKKAIALHWPTPMAYHNLAKYYLNKQDSLDIAGGMAMAAIHHMGIDRRGYLLLGNIYYTQEKYKMAKLQYFKGSRMFPEDAEFHFLLGKTYLKLENKAEAQKSLRAALDLNLSSPQKEEAEASLGRL